MSAAQNLLKFAWLEVTGLCNEFCDHCYADSSPKGTHGTMTVPDWKNTIDQLSAMGARDVQFIGGEPTLYPHLRELIEHAHGTGLEIEVFSNLTHIRNELWETFAERGVKLATSYYSDSAEDHDAMTQLRGSHKRTRANVEKALSLNIPLRGGVVAVREGQRVQEAARDLTALGVGTVGGDRTRAFGRAVREPRRPSLTCAATAPMRSAPSGRRGTCGPASWDGSSPSAMCGKRRSARSGAAREWPR
ncbi:radical SAM protein [Streptomyces uncialis]|uniref:radical SAM protein n=1 Tax=Streptomyces uncialis TaxID=1048205 RepID=UPI00382226EA